MRVQLVSAVLRLLALGCIAAAAWTVTLTAGLAVTGLCLLAVIYLPDGDTQ